MIIVANKNRENIIWFEQNCYQCTSGDFSILLVDRATNKTYEFTCEDKHLASYGFYSFAINFKDLPRGEYEYKVTSIESEVIVATGLIRLNEPEQEIVVHNENRTYVAYES